MNLFKRIVILAGALGLFFYTASQDQLVAAIADYQLSWYQLGVPVAWGIILGGLLALLRIQKLLSWLPPITLIASGLTTMGLVGAVAIFAKHQLVVLALPALQIASIGVGLYLFAVSYTRLTGDITARKQDKTKS